MSLKIRRFYRDCLRFTSWFIALHDRKLIQSFISMTTYQQQKLPIAFSLAIVILFLYILEQQNQLTVFYNDKLNKTRWWRFSKREGREPASR